MRIIDADALKDTFYKAMYDCISMDMDRSARILNSCINRISEAPTIPTKQVKYFDEDEKVWKIGSVIVDE